MKKIIISATILIFASAAVFGIIYNKNMQNGKVSKLSFLVAEKNINDLSKEAKKIVIANVDKILPSQLAPNKVNDSDMIYTDVILSIDNTIKGDHTDILTVRLPGGTVGEGKEKRSILVEDIPEFETGSKVMLFLGKGTDGLFQLPENYYSIYGGFQGVYKIKDDQAINPRESLSIEQLLNEVRETIQN